MANNEESTCKGRIVVHRACRHNPYGMPEDHYHPYTEIYYLVTGETRYFIAGEVYNMKKGDLAIIPSGVLHRTNNTNSKYCERINVTFDETHVSDPRLIEGMAPRIIRSQDFNGFPIEALLVDMEKEFIAENDFSEVMLKSYLDKLLVTLYRMGSTPKPESGISPADRPFLDAARYISEHYGEDLTLESLAKRFAVSPGHFSKKFKSTTGFGLNKYITQVRIMNAEKMLIHTKLSVTEISMRCGFSDSNYFAAVFKAQKGIPPYRYAKMHRSSG